MNLSRGLYKVSTLAVSAVLAVLLVGCDQEGSPSSRMID